MPKDGYKSVSIPEEQHATASSYKPQNASWSWGDALVAGAERLNDDLDSDAQRFGETTDSDALAERIVDAIGSEVGGPAVGDSEMAASVARQLDYTHLADKVSEQVVSQLEGRR